MVLIHVGFLAYEMGASRQKNVLASSIKNILAFAFLVPAFYYIGWFIYWAFPTGFSMSQGPLEISGFDYAVGAANPAGSVMGPNIEDNATGVFWGAFTLFAATTASIMSGAVIERIRLFAFLVLAIVLGALRLGVRRRLGLARGRLPGHRLGLPRLRCRGASCTWSPASSPSACSSTSGPRIGKFGPNGRVNHIPDTACR